jgi:hypothetical protein
VLSQPAVKEWPLPSALRQLQPPPSTPSPSHAQITSTPISFYISFISHRRPANHSYPAFLRQARYQLRVTLRVLPSISLTFLRTSSDFGLRSRAIWRRLAWRKAHTLGGRSSGGGLRVWSYSKYTAQLFAVFAWRDLASNKAKRSIVFVCLRARKQFVHFVPLRESQLAPGPPTIERPALSFLFSHTT